MSLPALPTMTGLQRLAGQALGALALAALSALAPASPAHADGDQARQHYRTPARAHSAWGPEIVIYGDRGFSGPRAVITGAADLRGSRFNDRISSVEVRGGSWLACSDPGFRGRCEVLAHDEPELARIGLNDRITSLRPVDGRPRRQGGGYGFQGGGLYGGPGYDGGHGGYGHGKGRGGRHGGFADAPVILFADPDGRGRAVPIFGPEPHLNPLRMNDVVSSIDVRSGAWLVCSDPDYRGRCEVISGYAPRTRDFGLNDNISSIRPAADRGRRGKRWH